MTPSEDPKVGDDYYFDNSRESETPIWPLPSLMTIDERACLMRCSMVRKFDGRLFSLHLRTGEARLADLVARHWIETDKKKDDPRYWVARRLRPAAWRLWWPEGADPGVPPAQLRTL